MKLTPEQYLKVVDLVQSQWKENAACTVCGNIEWNVSQEIYELREFQHGGIVLGGGDAIAPILPVTCGVCGHTILFNALVLGIDLKEPTSERAAASPPAAPISSK